MAERGKLPIPAAALSQHVIALGKTRAGKSSKLRVIVEHLLSEDRPVCIIDPKGDWWGLKSSADGKSSGFPIVIFGGDHGDVPLNQHAGAHVAELVATGNRSCLIDLGGWMVGERTRFFIDFASTLFKLTRGARFLAIDEVHNFAPKGKVFDVDAGKALHWANRLASEGAGKGLTLLAASQRPQKVHNDFLTSCETLIACRVIHKADRDAIKDWIDGCADPAIGREVLTELAGMKRPEAWVWSPEINFGPERITWPMFSTYDSFKPQAADATKLKGWAAVDLEDVKTKLAAVVAEAEANDPKTLKKRIRELEQQLGTAAPAGPTEEEIQARIDLAVEAVWAEARADMERHVAAAVEALRLDARPHVEGLQHILLNGWQPPAAAVPAPAPSRRFTQPVVVPPRARPAPAARRTEPRAAGSIGKGERVILTAIAQHEDGVTREQLTVLTGYKRSSRDTYLQKLQQRGLIEPGVGGTIIVTAAGFDELGDDFEPLPTGDALRAHWMSELGGGERAILGVVCDAWPDWIERSAIDESTLYKRSSRDTYLQKLAARRLIEVERGAVRASDQLFSRRPARR